MSISKLIPIIEAYDPYGIHRVNGLKSVYILLILYFFNMILNIPNVYFYYFYLPITAMTVETLFDNVKDKMTAFTYAVMGACTMVFLFNILRPYPLFFLYAIFLSSVCLYLLAIHKKPILIPTVPIILSLAAYSLLYPNLNSNIHMVINNAITTLVALMIIFSSLVLFPLGYYYRLWLRAYILLLQETVRNFHSIAEKKIAPFSLVMGHTKHTLLFAKMLPRSLPTFSILKMNFLANQLHLASCVRYSQYTEMTSEELNLIIQQISYLINAMKLEKLCMIDSSHKDLSKLILTWNHICSTI